MSQDNDIKELGALLDEVSSKVPKLITGLLDTLYSPEAGRKIGQSVGALYSELIASGIPADEAMKMARDYMISLKDVAGSFSNGNK